jgi:hypothetical protein
MVLTSILGRSSQRRVMDRRRHSVGPQNVSGGQLRGWRQATNLVYQPLRPHPSCIKSSYTVFRARFEVLTVDGCLFPPPTGCCMAYVTVDQGACLINAIRDDCVGLVAKTNDGILNNHQDLRRRRHLIVVGPLGHLERLCPPS